MKGNEKSFVRGWLFWVVMFVVVVMVTTVNAVGVVRVKSFAELGNFSTIQVQNLNMAFGDNLLVRVDGVDKVIGLEAGEVYGAGDWHLGLTKSDGTVVGWAKNSLKSWSGYEGWLTGKYNALLGDNGRPSHAFLVYDSLVGLGGEGWQVDTSTGVIGSTQDLLDGDLFFMEGDILFGGVLGDVSKLPPFIANNGGQSAILPKMTVVIGPPEPVEPPSDFNDLAILSENWLMEGCLESTGDCDGADWTGDGKVNFLDFAELARLWK